MADRVSQDPVEAIVLPTSQLARVSQDPVEAIVLPTSQRARLSQAVVEVIATNAAGSSYAFVLG